MVSLAAQKPAKPMTTAVALQRYADGDRGVIAQIAQNGMLPVWTIAEDLRQLPKKKPEFSRDAAAFAVEAARALETQNSKSACQLIGDARMRFVGAGARTEFARRWHAAAIAALLRSDCAALVEQSIAAALEDFPTEPRFRLARAVAAEQQLTARLDDGQRPSGRELRDVETRFKIAMALPPVAAEAALRWSRVNALVGQHAQAIQLAGAALSSPDPVLKYLAHLFRGWSLAATDQPDEADAEYAQALGIMPGAQSAVLARAVLAFHQRDASRAEQMVAALTSRAEPADDPWWNYALGDGQYVDRFIAELRQVIR